MHRFMLNAPSGVLVDHINRDKLDNRCINLRLVTPQENVINRDKQSNNSTGYPGVQYRKDRGRYVAIIGRNRRYIKLGAFGTPEEAYGAYLTARECL